MHRLARAPRASVPGMNVRLCLLAAAQILALALHASPPAELAAVYAETLRPYAGPVVRGVDASTLTGRVMCGYQGWFNAEGDGANRGYHHWAKGSARPAPGNPTVEMWPDLSGFAAEERFPTDLKHADGRTAEVFSSARKPTVLRHFEWMREYGIDGVFVQRFAGPLRDSRHLRANNVVLDHCREGANRSGRAYAVMYDLSGLGPGRVAGVAADWHELRTKMRITEDAAYLRHRGKPLVAIWGVGFNDDRRYTVAECRELVELLKKDGCSVMLGVPTGWRELHRDAVKDPALHDVLKLADVVSPWTVGRYRTPAEAARHGAKVVEPDIAWCRENGPDYMPVAFPGFSWANLKRDASNAIPRLKGEFLWSQFVAAKKAGATSLYVAMFDEVDEGTAIFKCTNDVPVSPQDQFATYEGLPSDFYLKLTGRGARLLRGEIPIDSGQ